MSLESTGSRCEQLARQIQVFGRVVPIAETVARIAAVTVEDAQRAAAETVMREVAEAKIWPAPLVTEIEPLGVFYEAEPEHHDYYARNPYTGYCQAVVGPKVAKFRKSFAHRLKSRAA